MREDLSIVVETNVPIQELFDAIESLKDSRILSIKVGEVIPWKNKKSILLNFEYYDKTKTLTDKEGEEVRKQIIDSLKKKVNAEIRSL